MKPHKWHKEIKAWADGAEIEFKELGKQEWNDDDDPEWCDPSFEFRIKPREYTYYTKVKISFKSQGIVNTEFDEMASYHSDGDNLKLTFDSRGTLIGVEVIGDDYESN